MVYNEIIQDLFEVDSSYYLAHCISADFALGKGIAVEFDKRFDMKRELQTTFPDYLNTYREYPIGGECLPALNRVFNLVTKERYFHKPTYESILNALISMLDYCYWNDIRKVAMPTIGCGLDGLKWERVSALIKDVFDGMDIEILVCFKE